MEASQKLTTGRRRPHRKSRTGCFECRRRRIKCGEERPACLACVRHDHPCVYPSNITQIATPCPTPATDHPTVQSLGSEASLTSSLSIPCLTETDQASSSKSTFHLDDLALLHHWTLSTSLDIVKSSGGDEYWQTVFPQVAFRHAFVIHGILGLAALHLAYRQSAERERLLLIAAHHHNIALQGFQEGISQMTDENSDALFVCATLNILHVFGVFGPLYDGPTTGRKSRILGAEWIPMIRGVGAVLQPVHERVRFGPLSPLLGLGNWDELDPDDQPAAEDNHFRSIQQVWAQSHDADVYDKTLYLLRKCNAYMRQFKSMSPQVLADWGYHQAWSGPFICLHSIPDEYFELLQQRQPPALLLFTYLGTLFHGLNDYWFMDGWGRSMVDVADDLMGEYWSKWMAWPKAVMMPESTSISIRSWFAASPASTTHPLKNPGLIPSMKSLKAGEVQKKRDMVEEMLEKF
ncbi:hypothetical protein N0V84_008058 [Fusarium piperis]|uniref:Zn(2)-C6 fungal-type domain-containing protein n=1 Tax=Fusarium piperis TaxID=1435070 RepID=A0A9W9BKK5_9HYPO|nr:hypothetical protein N0V84_008058 [Fusarium piperis]